MREESQNIPSFTEKRISLDSFTQVLGEAVTLLTTKDLFLKAGDYDPKFNCRKRSEDEEEVEMIEKGREEEKCDRDNNLRRK